MKPLFLLSLLYSSPSHHTLQDISDKNMVIFHTLGKQERIISPISGKEIVHNPNFIFFSSILPLSKDGAISFCS